MKIVNASLELRQGWKEYRIGSVFDLATNIEISDPSSVSLSKWRAQNIRLGNSLYPESAHNSIQDHSRQCHAISHDHRQAWRRSADVITCQAHGCNDGRSCHECRPPIQPDNLQSCQPDSTLFICMDDRILIRRFRNFPCFRKGEAMMRKSHFEGMWKELFEEHHSQLSEVAEILLYRSHPAGQIL